MYKFIRILAGLTAIGMLFVLLGGALVTKTGSGDGCGTDWPLCNGKFVPEYTIESMIEYSHRFVSGIVGLLVLAAFILVYMKLKHRKDARFFASLTLIFTVVQALLGAAAVKWPQSDFVMAAHFGISLIAFAAALLLAFVLRGVHNTENNASWQLQVGKAQYPVKREFRGLVWATTLYCYFVVYMGALVRHTDATSGCQGWPTCNGALIPDMSISIVGINFIHRIGAGLLLLIVLGMALIAIRDYKHVKEIVFSAKASIWLIVLQIFSGGAVSVSLSNDLAFLLNSLLHALLVSLLFGILSYLSVLVWQWRERPQSKTT